MIELRTKERKPDEADEKNCLREFFIKLVEMSYWEKRSTAAEKEKEKREPETHN